MAVNLTFRCGDGISKFVVHVSNDNRFPKTISTTSGQTWSGITQGASCWIDGIVYKSGYSGARAKCSLTGNDWNLVTDNTVGTSKSRNVTVYATKSTATYKVKVVFGDGIKRVGYGVNTTAVSNLASQDFTANVGADGYLYISIANYLDKYSYPVTASSGSSSWTVINANGIYNDHYISAPSSAGTRTVTLTATEYKTYYYNVHVFANGGKFSDGSSDYYTGVASSSTISIEYSLVGLKKPTRAGYTFLGWGYSSNATQYYTDTITISATSQSSGNPTIYNIYAIWTKTEYDAYIRMGAGISSMAVYVDGALKSQISDTKYHKLTVNLESSIVMKSIAKKTGYEKPYTVNFYISATSTTPNTSLESSSDEVEYLYYSHHKYAELTAKKANIDLFYWQNATWDAANIKAGQPVSNLTATRWNNLLAKIKELAEAEGDSYSYTGVSSGASILATTFNGARTAISNRTGHGTLPSTQAKDDPVKAALFEGTGSLKSALNAAITHYNNS